MAKAVRISDGKEFEYVLFNGKNLDEARLLFKSTNKPSSEVIACSTATGLLELRLFGDTGYHASLFVDAGEYILNSGGRPEIYEAGPFSRTYQMVSSKEALESQTKYLWNDVSNTLNIREALNWYLQSDTIGESYTIKFNNNTGGTVSKCDGNCKCKKSGKEKTAITAEVFMVGGDFDPAAFQAFIGKEKPFQVVYSYNSVGSMFRSVIIQTGTLFGVEIKSGDSVLRTSNGVLAVAHNTHTSSSPK